MKSRNQIKNRIKKLVKKYLVLYKDYGKNFHDPLLSINILNHIRQIMADIKTLAWVSGIKYKKYFPKDVIIYGHG